MELCVVAFTRMVGTAFSKISYFCDILYFYRNRNFAWILILKIRFSDFLIKFRRTKCYSCTRISIWCVDMAGDKCGAVNKHCTTHGAICVHHTENGKKFFPSLQNALFRSLKARLKILTYLFDFGWEKFCTTREKDMMSAMGVEIWIIQIINYVNFELAVIFEKFSLEN